MKDKLVMASDQNVRHKNLRDKMVVNEKVGTNSDSKPPDHEDLDSLEEHPLDIGEHYLVRRNDDSWREYIQILTVFRDIVDIDAIIVIA